MVPDLLKKFPTRGAARPEALIAVVAARNAQREVDSFRRTWQSAVPRAEFVGLSIDVAGRGNARDFAGRLVDAATRRRLSVRHVILLGKGFAGRAALDHVLQGRIPAAGVLALDIALWPAPRPCPQSATIVRIVQHQRPDDPGCALYFALLDEVRSATADVRHALLEHHSATTAKETFCAGTGYLVELVAHASRLPSNSETPP